jgi:catechol 2,3-dioxygenase-like lactoylglutathione lyase family enzyme
MSNAKFKHVSMVARNADALAEFYRKVFGCEVLRPKTILTGKKVGQGNGLPQSEILSIWLTLPGVDGPFLEIHQYKDRQERAVPEVNEPGYSHLSFQVEDIHATRALILQSGGTELGEITDFGTADASILLVYIRDPEGNIIEIEQR